jgi:hypothetical protein
MTCIITRGCGFMVAYSAVEWRYDYEPSKDN